MSNIVCNVIIDRIPVYKHFEENVNGNRIPRGLFNLLTVLNLSITGVRLSLSEKLSSKEL